MIGQVKRTYLDAELTEVEVIAAEGKLSVGDKEIGTVDMAFVPHATTEEALKAIPQEDATAFLRVLNTGLRELKREKVEAAVEALIPADSIPGDAYLSATKPFVKAEQAKGLNLKDARAKVESDVKSSDVMKAMIRLLAERSKTKVEVEVEVPAAV